MKYYENAVCIPVRGAYGKEAKVCVLKEEDIGRRKAAIITDDGEKFLSSIPKLARELRREQFYPEDRTRAIAFASDLFRDIARQKSGGGLRINAVGTEVNGNIYDEIET